jgi:hypothetical protein
MDIGSDDLLILDNEDGRPAAFSPLCGVGHEGCYGAEFERNIRRVSGTSNTRRREKVGV